MKPHLDPIKPAAASWQEADDAGPANKCYDILNPLYLFLFIILKTMFDLPPSTDPELLKALLEPLLDDFDDWFSQSKALLESEPMRFMTPEAQQDLLGRVLESLGAVSVMRSLMVATENRAGVDMAVLMKWHKLVHECWSVSIKYRQDRSVS